MQVFFICIGMYVFETIKLGTWKMALKKNQKFPLKKNHLFTAETGNEIELFEIKFNLFSLSRPPL